MQSEKESPCFPLPLIWRSESLKSRKRTFWNKRFFGANLPRECQKPAAKYLWVARICFDQMSQKMDSEVSRKIFSSFLRPWSNAHMTNCRSLLCERAEQTASLVSKNPPFLRPKLIARWIWKPNRERASAHVFESGDNRTTHPRDINMRIRCSAMKGMRLKGLTLDIPFLPFRDSRSRVHMMKMDNLEGVLKKDKVNKLLLFSIKLFSRCTLFSPLFSFSIKPGKRHERARIFLSC